MFDLQARQRETVFDFILKRIMTIIHAFKAMIRIAAQQKLLNTV